ncbi:MAG: hypothetical protein M4579_001312 [Chaenotheca gracillima]|nr:MAG: hypothetical protein M4579_001312 [Chaenotheca gracillima]
MSRFFRRTRSSRSPSQELPNITEEAGTSSGNDTSSFDTNTSADLNARQVLSQGITHNLPSQENAASPIDHLELDNHFDDPLDFDFVFADIEEFAAGALAQPSLLTIQNDDAQVHGYQPYDILQQFPAQSDQWENAPFDDNAYDGAPFPEFLAGDNPYQTETLQPAPQPPLDTNNSAHNAATQDQGFQIQHGQYSLETLQPLPGQDNVGMHGVNHDQYQNILQNSERSTSRTDLYASNNFNDQYNQHARGDRPYEMVPFDPNQIQQPNDFGIHNEKHNVPRPNNPLDYLGPAILERAPTGPQYRERAARHGHDWNVNFPPHITHVHANNNSHTEEADDQPLGDIRDRIVEVETGTACLPQPIDNTLGGESTAPSQQDAARSSAPTNLPTQNDRVAQELQPQTSNSPDAAPWNPHGQPYYQQSLQANVLGAENVLNAGLQGADPDSDTESLYTPPENDDFVHAFENGLQAKEARERHLRRPFPGDPTLPNGAAEEKLVVRRLVLAMKDVTDTRDYPESAREEGRKPPQAYSVFANGRFDDEHVQAVCWGLLEKAKLKHTSGQLVPDWQRSRRPTRHESFKALIEELCTTLKAQKTICKRLMDASFADDLLDNPAAQLKRAFQNKRLNNTKARHIREGRKVVVKEEGESAVPVADAEGDEVDEEADGEGSVDGFDASADAIQPSGETVAPPAHSSTTSEAAPATPGRSAATYGSPIPSEQQRGSKRKFSEAQQSSSADSLLEGSAGGPDASRMQKRRRSGASSGSQDAALDLPNPFPLPSGQPGGPSWLMNPPVFPQTNTVTEEAGFPGGFFGNQPLSAPRQPANEGQFGLDLEWEDGSDVWEAWPNSMGPPPAASQGRGRRFGGSGRRRS